MSETTRERFDRQIRELGGESAYDEWLGTNYKHRVICKKGHELFPRPADVNQGHGICQSCNVSARMEPIKKSCEAKFAAKVNELGGVPSWDAWRGVDSPHRIICKEGHECSPRPSDIKRGQGMCSICAGHDTYEAEKKFLARLSELGAVPSYNEWLGVREPHRIVCREGHNRSIRPSHVITGLNGVCAVCAGNDSVSAKQNFIASLTVAGAVLISPYSTALKLHKIVCSEGHEIEIKPNRVQQQGFACYLCKGTKPAWDIFYVVRNPSTHQIKFGITSGDPRQRLSTHRCAGFTEQLYLHENFEGAHDLETSVKRGLAISGFEPVRGHEYFREDTLPFIMSMLPALDLSSSLCTVVMPRSLGVVPIGFGGRVNDRRACCRRVPFGIS